MHEYNYVSFTFSFLFFLQIKIKLFAQVGHSALNDVKIFIREDPVETGQHYFINSLGSGWLHETYQNEAENANHAFDVVSSRTK